jgi:hypothetical protein
MAGDARSGPIRLWPERACEPGQRWMARVGSSRPSIRAADGLFSAGLDVRDAVLDELDLIIGPARGRRRHVPCESVGL